MTSRPRPLFVGVDRYVLRACARRGIPAVVVYGPYWRDSGIPDLPDCVTAVFVEDECSAEAVLTALTRAGLGEERFASVTTTNEYALINVAVLAQALGCPGIPPAVALRFRDKFLQKEAVRARGIATARSFVLEDIHDDELPELPFEAGVIKPVTGAATRQTATVRSTDELHKTVRRFRSEAGSARTFVVEEFQQGDEWMVDGVIHDGEVRFLSVAEYTHTCLSVVESQATMQDRRFDPATEEWAFRLAEPVVRAALEALDLTDGIFHMELFHHEGEVVFSECAARRGGFVQEQVECKFGVDLGDAALSLALGEAPDVTVRERPGIVGGTYITTSPGLLFGVPSHDEVMSLPNVEYVLLGHLVGASLPANSDTTKRIGEVVITTGTLEEFHKRSEEVLAWFADRITVIPATTKRRELHRMQSALGYDTRLMATYQREDG
ncbi:ATP-grasp domain-containing protein [Streptomyces sp. NRRL S-244]|uniref:ATP-grasp domain-containing protein n=1 Tax=Streptomyces sp. NRRL S-244 TaxID=1463897 RepID=UPI0004C1CB91|nr:ATP-grasp domain-containing protein [Streptomyces sp. NRRL S-244]